MYICKSASLCSLFRTLHAFREFIQGQVPIIADFHKYLRYWFFNPFQDQLCLPKSSSMIGPPENRIYHTYECIRGSKYSYVPREDDKLLQTWELIEYSKTQRRDQENVHKRSPASLLFTDINCSENLVYRIVSQQINYFSGFLFILPAFV